MTQEERTNKRDLTYSAWHRRGSIRRFIGIEKAQLLAMIDADASLYVEYDDRTMEPLALIETAIDFGQQHKTATVTRNLARRVVPQIEAYVVLYKRSSDVANPADSNWPDIESFRVKRVWPEPVTDFHNLRPQAWADALLAIRERSAANLDAQWKTQRHA